MLSIEVANFSAIALRPLWAGNKKATRRWLGGVGRFSAEQKLAADYVGVGRPGAQAAPSAHSQICSARMALL